MKTKNKKITPRQFRAFLLWFIALLSIIVIYQKADIKLLMVAAAPADRHAFLPQNPDRTDLTVAERIRIIAHKAGFQWPDYLVKLAYCESRFDPWAFNMNGGHSLDRGLFQINQRYHPDVSSECAFDIECATTWTMEQINAGRQSMWMCDKLIK
jgi:hypothetical protein